MFTIVDNGVRKEIKAINKGPNVTYEDKFLSRSFATKLWNRDKDKPFRTDSVGQDLISKGEIFPLDMNF